MKKTVTLCYRNMWSEFETTKYNSFTNVYFEEVLGQQYEVVIDQDHPDIVIVSVFGQYLPQQFSHNPLTVWFTGENQLPTQVHDVYFGFIPEHQTYGIDNYFRLPLWAWFIDWFHKTRTRQVDTCKLLQYNNILTRHQQPTEHSANKRFCNFIYSNLVGSRINFFQQLSQYRLVESTGKVLNNTGYLIGNRQDGRHAHTKTEDLVNYKFNIAFENTIAEGYITEKLLEPLAAGCVPIYFGDVSCKHDFNPKSFIYVRDFKNFAEAVEYIKYVDRDEQVFNTYLKEPVFLAPPIYTPDYTFERIYRFLIKKRPHLKLD